MCPKKIRNVIFSLFFPRMLILASMFISWQERFWPDPLGFSLFDVTSQICAGSSVLSCVCNQRSKFPSMAKECWVLLSDDKYGKRNKVPQVCRMCQSHSSSISSRYQTEIVARTNCGPQKSENNIHQDLLICVDGNRCKLRVRTNSDGAVGQYRGAIHGRGGVMAFLYKKP